MGQLACKNYSKNRDSLSSSYLLDFCHLQKTSQTDNQKSLSLKSDNFRPKTLSKTIT